MIGHAPRYTAFSFITTLALVASNLSKGRQPAGGRTAFALRAYRDAGRALRPAFYRKRPVRIRASEPGIQERTPRRYPIEPIRARRQAQKTLR